MCFLVTAAIYGRILPDDFARLDHELRRKGLFCPPESGGRGKLDVV